MWTERKRKKGKKRWERKEEFFVYIAVERWRKRNFCRWGYGAFLLFPGKIFLFVCVIFLFRCFYLRYHLYILFFQSLFFWGFLHLTPNLYIYLYFGVCVIFFLSILSRGKCEKNNNSTRWIDEASTSTAATAKRRKLAQMMNFARSHTFPSSPNRFVYVMKTDSKVASVCEILWGQIFTSFSIYFFLHHQQTFLLASTPFLCHSFPFI